MIRKIVPLVACGVLAGLVQACGGGGGGNGGQSQVGVTVTPGPVGPTATETPIPVDIIVQPGTDIAAAVRRAQEGAFIIVPPGLYPPVVLTASDAKEKITLFADITGQFSGHDVFKEAKVIIDARNADAAISLTDQFDLSIDGFTVRGGRVAGLLAERSAGILVTDCYITDNPGDGIFFEGSDSNVIFDNIIYNNGGSGLRLSGTRTVEVSSNTMYGNGMFGLFIGSDAAAVDTVVKNNIFYHNLHGGISVDASSRSGYVGDYNLNVSIDMDLPPYFEDTPRGLHDINNDSLGQFDPLFISPVDGDFHLSENSPAVNAGDLNTDAGTVSVLAGRTTQVSGLLDEVPVDLGFHYIDPVVFATPTRAGVTPSPTRTTRVSTPTATRTRTRTPTP